MGKKQILEAIKKYNSFLIASHINPEGDSIGSQLAMANLLKGMGKKVRIINSDAVPRNLAFLPGAARIETAASMARRKRGDFEAVVILDCPSLDRIGTVRDLLGDGTNYIVSIDHHISNTKFGDVNWTDCNASSAGEMVYALYKQSRREIDKESALCLYVAIMTDTGSFHYSNTTAKTHRIIAELLNFNINVTKIYEYIYETKSFETLKLLAEVLTNLKRTKDGRFVWFKVTNAMLRRNRLTAESTDDFIDFVRMVEGSEVVAFLREVHHGRKVKVSLRSKSDIDVNKIAGHFGGGGHYAASGCMIDKNVDEAEKILLAVVKKAFTRKR